jgi:CheY-like chemotaxis protein
MVSKVKVLVIDDDDEHIAVLQACADESDRVELKIIQLEGDITEQVKKWDPAVVLLDAHSEAINAVKILTNELTQAVQIVVTSRSNSPEIEAWAKREGAAGYFPNSGSRECVEVFLEELAELPTDVTKH